MYRHASAPHHLHRPTRIWDAALKPRLPMRPDEPSDLLSDLLDCLFHPVGRFRRLIQRKPSWAAMPWLLWSLLTFIAIAGSLLYGASVGLVLPDGNPAFEAIAITLSAGAGWAFPHRTVWETAAHAPSGSNPRQSPHPDRTRS